MGMTPTGGSHGNQHPTARIHCHARRRGGSVAVRGARQHAPGKVAHVGIIDDSPSWDPFRQRLRELNYVEGQNIAHVYLRTDGSPAQLDAAAAALVQVPVNVIVAFGTPPGSGNATGHEDHSYRCNIDQRPDRSGPSDEPSASRRQHHRKYYLGPDIVTKKLQILKDAFPAVARVAYLWKPR